ncbi:sensor histidine kinase [Tsukamurella pulmonis]|uniref:sensor histidine kinase n=1 Tax=Tsukamurella pulmonis TaxID=47312 RepID=UPI0008387324|nr:histidine kinase [Tsukamurella pulmonis]
MAVLSLLGIAMAFGVAMPYARLAASSMVTLAVAVAIWTWWRAKQMRVDFEARLAAWSAHEARRAEQIRIARELHDGVSNSLALILMRAAVDRDRGSDTQRRALAAIESSARTTIAQLREMLLLLRGDGEAPRGSVDLEALVSNSRAAGMHVAVTKNLGSRITPEVAEMIHAVVGEGLSNAARHCGPCRAEVHVDDSAAGGLAVEVRDSGAVPGWVPAPGSGSGLSSLETRIANVHGVLTFDHCDEGSTLAAWIPRRDRSESESA